LSEIAAIIATGAAVLRFQRSISEEPEAQLPGIAIILNHL
jgi:hypothetical protein